MFFLFARSYSSPIYFSIWEYIIMYYPLFLSPCFQFHLYFIPITGISRHAFQPSVFHAKPNILHSPPLYRFPFPSLPFPIPPLPLHTCTTYSNDFLGRRPLTEGEGFNAKHVFFSFYFFITKIFIFFHIENVYFMSIHKRMDMLQKYLRFRWGMVFEKN